MTDAKIFDEYGKFYDLLYQDKNYEAEAAYIVGLLEARGIGSGELLEFGSGTGRHGRLLAARGYKILGIERSPEMVAKATAVAGFICQQGDVCAVALNRHFDAVLALFHVVSYQATDAAADAIFGRAAAHLRTGGLFLFDVWHGPAVVHERPSVRVKRVADGAHKALRVAEPTIDLELHTVRVNYTLFTSDDFGRSWLSIEESHLLRYFTSDEISRLCARHGFEIVLSEEWLTARSPSDSTWGVCYVARKS